MSPQPRSSLINARVQVTFLNVEDTELQSERPLSAAECVRGARFKFEKDRKRFIAVRSSLRKILARETGVAPEDLVIWEANHEKPRLVIPPGVQQVHFNVSHSGDYAVIAVSRDAQVGVDIEQIRAGQPFLDLARRFYSARENSWLQSIAPERQAEAFCRIWAVKEAVLKCAGLGLSVPTQNVDVVFTANAPPIVKCRDPEWKQLERFSVQELRLVDGYASALAVDAEKAELEVVGT